MLRKIRLFISWLLIEKLFSKESVEIVGKRISKEVDAWNRINETECKACGNDAFDAFEEHFFRLGEGDDGEWFTRCTKCHQIQPPDRRVENELANYGIIKEGMKYRYGLLALPRWARIMVVSFAILIAIAGIAYVSSFFIHSVSDFLIAVLIVFFLLLFVDQI